MSAIFNDSDLQEAYEKNKKMRFYSDEDKTKFSNDIKTLESLLRDNINFNCECIIKSYPDGRKEILRWDNDSGRIVYTNWQYEKNLIETPWCIRKEVYEYNELVNLFEKVSESLGE